jgi:uncharacterized protein YgiM (DUF1202 family)
VDAEVLNVRDAPSLNSEVAHRLQAGEMVTVLRDSSEWSKISIKGTEGWVYNRYLKPGYSVWVATKTLNVRQEPSLTSQVINQLRQGDEIIVIDAIDSWYQVEKDSWRGWVYSSLVTKYPRKGVGGNQDMKEQYLAEHSELPRIIRDAILEGRFTIGMNMEQVRISMGEPDSVEREPGADEGSAQWVYKQERVQNISSSTDNMGSDEAIIYLNFRHGYLWSWGRDFPIHSEQTTAN